MARGSERAIVVQWCFTSWPGAPNGYIAHRDLRRFQKRPGDLKHFIFCDFRPVIFSFFMTCNLAKSDQVTCAPEKLQACDFRGVYPLGAPDLTRLPLLVEVECLIIKTQWHPYLLVWRRGSILDLYSRVPGSIPAMGKIYIFFIKCKRCKFRVSFGLRTVTESSSDTTPVQKSQMLMPKSIQNVNLMPWH